MDKQVSSPDSFRFAQIVSPTCPSYMRRTCATFAGILAFVLLTLNDPAFGQRLQSATSYSVGANLSGVIVADFNRDGHPDMLVIDSPNNGSTNTIHVLLGNGDGTFQQPSIDSVATGALSAVVKGDFNGDGILDIAVTDSVNNTVTVLLGNGLGSFVAQTPMPTSSTPVALAVADLNGDGKPDLIVANFGSTTLNVFLGNGDGTFTSAGMVLAADPASGAFGPVGVVVADFNGDGKPDLAVALTSNAMSILKGNGDGTFQPAITNFIFNFPNPTAIAATDFNGDGKQDLIITAGSVLFLRGNGDLTFQSPVALGDQVAASAVSIADMNGDGHPDIVVTDSVFDGVSILINGGKGTVAATHDYSGPLIANQLAVGDFNGDGHQDIVATTSFPAFLNPNNIQTILGNGDGTMRGGFNYNFETGGEFGSPGKIIAADFNNDGQPDIAIADGAERITILKNSGGFNFSPIVPANALSDFVLDMAATDINHDGNQDIVMIGFDTISTLLGNGDGTFQPPLTQSIPFSGFRSIAIGDFNHDGKLDVAFTNPDQTLTTVGFLLGNGDGTFQPLEPQNILTAGALPTAITVGDFNGDGNLDLAVANAGDGATDSTVTIFLGNGQGQFTPLGQEPTVGVFPEMIAAVDLNHDGILDLVVGNTGNGQPGSVSVLIGNGDGTFKPAATLPLGASVDSLVVSDFNGDKFPDIAVLETGSRVELFTNNGDGTFPAAPTQYSAGGGAVSLAAADLNGGGLPDLLLGTNTTVVVLPNTGGTHITLTSSFNPSRLHQPVLFSATVAPNLPGYPTPTGSVQFLDGTVDLGTSILSDKGLARIFTSDLQAGTNFVVGSYSGDSNYVPHASPTLPQVVLPPGPPM